MKLQTLVVTTGEMIVFPIFPYFLARVVFGWFPRCRFGAIQNILKSFLRDSITRLVPLPTSFLHTKNVTIHSIVRSIAAHLRVHFYSNTPLIARRPWLVKHFHLTVGH
jgi:hypothetical protein